MRPTPRGVPHHTDLPGALRRAGVLAALAERRGRRVLGIAGAPGVGKSTVADAVVDALPGRAVLLPMDGFHLPQAELERLGRADRRGAPDTFDAAAFARLLRRVREQGDGVLPAPGFDRAAGEPVPDAIAVPPDVPLVVVEGNYLLHDDGDWAGIRPLLDDAWFLQADDAARVERLVARHVAFGKEPDAARRWALGPDQRNAELVAATRGRADVVVRL
jgi:pantothenate kinase